MVWLSSPSLPSSSEHPGDLHPNVPVSGRAEGTKMTTTLTAVTAVAATAPPLLLHSALNPSAAAASTVRANLSLSAVSSEAGPRAIQPPTVGTTACEQEHSECRVMRARSGPPGGRGLGGWLIPPLSLIVATRCGVAFPFSTCRSATIHGNNE